MTALNRYLTGLATRKTWTFILFLGLIGFFTVQWALPTSFQLTDLDPADEATLHIVYGSRGHVSYMGREWGPLYASWYKLLFVFEKNLLDLFYLNGTVVIFLTAIFYFIFLWKMEIPPLYCLVSSWTILLNPYFLLINRRSNHFALLILLLFFIGADFFKRRSALLVFLMFGTLLASYVRPEYFLSFSICVLLSLGYVFSPFSFSPPRIREKGALLATLMIFCGISLYVGTPLGEKSLDKKTMQVFLMKTFERKNGYGESNWKVQNPITFSNNLYHNPQSLTEAMVNNPKEFFSHLIFNGKNYVQVFYGVLAAYFPFLKTPWVFLFFSFGALFIFLSGKCGKQDSPQNFSQNGPKKEFYFYSFLALFPFIPSSLVFGTLTQYMMGQWPFIIPLLLTIKIRLRPFSYPSRFLPSYIIIFSLLLNFFPPSPEKIKDYFVKKPEREWFVRPEKTISKTIQYLQNLNCPGINLLSELGTLWPFVHPEAKGEDLYKIIHQSDRESPAPTRKSFLAMIKERGLNLVIISKENREFLANLAPPRFGREMLDFFTDTGVLKRMGFQHLIEIDRTMDIFIKKDFFHSCAPAIGSFPPSAKFFPLLGTK